MQQRQNHIVEAPGHQQEPLRSSREDTKTWYSQHWPKHCIADEATQLSAIHVAMA